MKEKLKIVGGIISAVALIAFALTLMANDIKLNIASWLLWTILDVLILLASLDASKKAGKNDWPWLPTGWTVGAALVTAILFFRGSWQWTNVETLTVCTVALATVVWKASSSKVGVVALTAAMTVAGIPSLHLAWINPDPSSWWMWFAVCVSCLFTLAGTKSWTIEERFLPIASLIFNGTMVFLLLR